jgi:hypothetical protein
MKYVVFGFFDEAKFAAMPREQQQRMLEPDAFDYELQRSGHLVGGQALEPARNAVTLRMKEGQVEVTDGPFVETKETLGGFMVLEARDLNHAITLISKHPGLGVGNIFEIRPVDEAMNQLVDAAFAKMANKGT